MEKDMQAAQISDILDDYRSIAEAAEAALRADKSLMDDESRHLPIPWSNDFTTLEMNIDTEELYGEGEVWTNLYGGGNEHVAFSIPLDTLNKYL